MCRVPPSPHHHAARRTTFECCEGYSARITILPLVGKLPAVRPALGLPLQCKRLCIQTIALKRFPLHYDTQWEIHCILTSHQLSYLIGFRSGFLARSEKTQAEKTKKQQIAAYTDQISSGYIVGKVGKGCKSKLYMCLSTH